MSPKRNNHTGLKIFLFLLILVFIAGSAFMIKLSLDLMDKAPESKPTQELILPSQEEKAPAPATEATEPPTETTMPAPETVVATASISSQGDLLMHKPVITSCLQSDGTYDFESVFRYMNEYTTAYDYALANLETTFGGTGFPYQGNPSFNCPDDLMENIVEAGYDMLLTANNHSYDTLMTGINRTLEQVRAKNIQTLGTRLSEEESRYSVVDINGIKVGMVCYTYTMSMNGNKPVLNGNSPMDKPAQINFFRYNNLNGFYTEIEEVLSQMKAEGAEATMLFIHWGTEYEVVENDYQNQIAQKMCDLGFDVIVGGHPHVVQPIELLTSSQDPDHQTVCLYSLGNVVSNQRIAEMRLKTGHTEDGLLFSVNFEKYSDGKVYLESVGVLPTWVNLSSVNGKLEYNVLPLDDSTRDQWQSKYNLTDALMTNCEDSYDRTMAIVGAGLEQANAHLAQEKADREAMYLDMAMNPDKYATEPTQAPAEAPAADPAETVPETTAEP